MTSKRTSTSAKAKKTKTLTPQDPPPELVENEDEPVYTLPELAGRFGDAAEEDVVPYVAGISKADLIERGRRVATSRIDKDAARMYGIAADFTARATEEELNAMPAFSKILLQRAVWAAYQGSLKAEARQAAVSKAGSAKEARQTDAATLRTLGLLQRDQMAAALRPLSGRDEKLLAVINAAAYGSVATAKELSNALSVLAGVGRTLLKDKSDAMKKRLEGTRLTEDRLNALEALAGDIRKKGDAAAAPITAATVPQADVDYWDGINLHLLEMLIDMFEAGNAQIPSIPRLVPISLRTVLGLRSAPKPAEPTPAPS
jgi:hypothetical protein